ncbi:MAG: LacI family transcriptional regulator [Defluviitaleaceae bacterium]|nr:LacI family transcriptional regulator [Defluviitaleaceae bacterium]
MSKAKLGDVAKHAGVSPTTVSRALNNRGYMSDKTKERINKAMQELNYFPNEVARSLHGGKTNLVGLLFPNVTNPFYGEIVTEIENALGQRGYKSLLCNTYNNPKQEEQYLNMLLANQVDGIIVGSRTKPSNVYQKANLAVVAIDRIISAKVPIVRSDNYAGACLATQYLIDQKFKRIALFTGSSKEEIEKGDLRVEGYIDTTKKHNLPQTICHIDFEQEDMYQKQRVLQFLTQNPKTDAIFATGDVLAGIVQGCTQDLGLKIAIVGYDGSKVFQNLCTNISTIRQPIEDMAKLAVDLTLDAIAGNFQKENKEFVLPVSLIKRSI